MTPPFTHMGKQVLSNGTHYADAIDPAAAERICEAMNLSAVFERLFRKHNSTIPVEPA